MLFIYGDSHGNDCFKNLKIPYIDLHSSNKTMYRVGRDRYIINYNRNHHTMDSIIILVYGEIDCRCHIQKQINLGQGKDFIINSLVAKYFESIAANVDKYKHIIVVAVIPPTSQIDYESINGPITHEYPFVGTDENRVMYTKEVNKLLELFCKKYNYIFFNPYEYYTRQDGCLKYELSDKTVHLKDTSYFHEQFYKLLSDLGT